MCAAATGWQEHMPALRWIHAVNGQRLTAFIHCQKGATNSTAHRLSQMLVLLLASHGMDGLLLLPDWCLAVSSPRTRTGLGSSQQSWGPVVTELQC
jgi:hypothetical protein